MQVDEGIDVLKQKYDANLAKKKAEEAKRLAAIIAAQKAKELAEQRAEAQRIAAKKAAEQRAQVTKNVPTVVTQDILNKLRDGDMKSLLSANPGVSQPIVGQTLNVPTLVKGTEGRITDPLNQINTSQQTVDPTKKYSLGGVLELALGKAGSAITTSLGTAFGKTLETTGNAIGMNLPQRGQGTSVMPKPTGLAAMSPELVQKQRDYIASLVPQGHVVKSPEDLSDILTKAYNGEVDEKGLPYQYPHIITGQEVRDLQGAMTPEEAASAFKDLIASGYIYNSERDLLIMGNYTLEGADVEEEPPPELTDGGYGGYDYGNFDYGGGGGGGKYKIELPGGFGLINWRVATG